MRIGEADAKVGSRNPLHFLTEKAVAKVPCGGEAKSGERKPLKEVVEGLASEWSVADVVNQVDQMNEAVRSLRFIFPQSLHTVG